MATLAKSSTPTKNTDLTASGRVPFLTSAAKRPCRVQKNLYEASRARESIMKTADKIIIALLSAILFFQALPYMIAFYNYNKLHEKMETKKPSGQFQNEHAEEFGSVTP